MERKEGDRIVAPLPVGLELEDACMQFSSSLSLAAGNGGDLWIA